MQALGIFGVLPPRMHNEGDGYPVAEQHGHTESDAVAGQHESTADEEKDNGADQQELLIPSDAVVGHKLLGGLEIMDAVICLVEEYEGEKSAGQ